jgi:hypothetical protein
MRDVTSTIQMIFEQGQSGVKCVIPPIDDIHGH